MGQLDGTLLNYIFGDLSNPVKPEILQVIVKQLFKLVARLSEYGYTHGDFHYGNIGYKMNKNGDIRLMVIDGSKTVSTSSVPEYDILTFAWYLLYDVKEAPEFKPSVKILIKMIQKEANDVYGLKFRGVVKSIGKQLYEFGKQKGMHPLLTPHVQFRPEGDEYSEEETKMHPSMSPFKRHDT